MMLWRRSDFASLLPHDFLTHRHSWRQAFQRLIELEPATSPPNPEDKSHWEHEARALDMAYAELDQVLRSQWTTHSTQEPEGGIWCVVQTPGGFFVGKYEQVPHKRWMNYEQGRWYFRDDARWRPFDEPGNGVGNEQADQAEPVQVEGF